MHAKDAVGAYGERVAERFLLEAGLVVLERNWRCPFGEIDIVARDGDCLVVCEVKTRSSPAFGHPVEAVTAVKTRGVRPREIRIDVVAVLRSVQGPATVTHLRAVA